MIKKIVMVIVILIVVALAGAYLVRNALVAKAVEEGGEYALGVKTDLGSASLDLGGGSLELNNFVVANPEGFEAADFMSMNWGMLDVESGSILDDEIVIDSLVIEGVRLNLEQVDKNGNYLVLLEHLRKLDLGSSSDGNRAFRIGKVAIRDIQVDGILSLAGREMRKTFAVTDFTLHDLGGAEGASIGAITAAVVQTLITKSVAAARGSLSSDFGANVSQIVDDKVNEVKSDAEEKLKDLGKSLIGK
jgi:hypothetical protein